MKHLHLLVPDLFPPQDIAVEVCADLRLPALEKILARGSTGASNIATLEDWLCRAFAADGVAPVRALADELATGEGYWLCADPAHLQLQHSRVVLLPEAVLNQTEADALCASLNGHFAGMGLGFHAPQPQRWYVRATEPTEVTMHPMSQVAWRDVKPFQPQGADAMRWQRIATEVQMLLHAHPVNQAREARGELAINTLWLWGGGRAARLQKAFDAVGGDSGLAGAFARATGVPQAGSVQAMLDGKCDSGLWVCGVPGEAQQCGDYHAWRDAVLRFEQECAQPVLKALRAGRLRRLTLEVLREGSGQRFELTRGDAWKLWRTARSLARYAV